MGRQFFLGRQKLAGKLEEAGGANRQPPLVEELLTQFKSGSSGTRIAGEIVSGSCAGTNPRPATTRLSHHGDTFFGGGLKVADPKIAP